MAGFLKVFQPQPTPSDLSALLSGDIQSMIAEFSKEVYAARPAEPVKVKTLKRASSGLRLVPPKSQAIQSILANPITNSLMVKDTTPTKMIPLTDKKG
jgi:hypothetical protein